MNKLKSIRQESGMSQSELSEKSGVKLSALQKLESGVNDIHGAKVITVYALAQALGCTVEDLIDYEK